MLSETEQPLSPLMEAPEPSLRVQQGNAYDKEDKNRTASSCASPEPAKHSSNRFPTVSPANNP